MDGDIREGKLADVVKVVTLNTAVNRILEERLARAEKLKKSAFGAVTRIESAISHIDTHITALGVGDLGSAEAAINKARQLLLEVLEIS